MHDTTIHWTTWGVFAVFFALVTVLGFVAARWKRADLDQLHEWGLGGRRFGTLISWFLIGGDFYTAYTVVAVPALVFAAGAYGFFAMPYTIIAYPFMFAVLPRLWNVCRRHGWLTTADFIEGRYGSHWLALAVARVLICEALGGDRLTVNPGSGARLPDRCIGPRRRHVGAARESSGCRRSHPDGHHH